MTDNQGSGDYVQQCETLIRDLRLQLVQAEQRIVELESAYDSAHKSRMELLKERDASLQTGALDMQYRRALAATCLIELIRSPRTDFSDGMGLVASLAARMANAVAEGLKDKKVDEEKDKG